MTKTHKHWLFSFLTCASILSLIVLIHIFSSFTPDTPPEDKIFGPGIFVASMITCSLITYHCALSTRGRGLLITLLTLTPIAAVVVIYQIFRDSSFRFNPTAYALILSLGWFWLTSVYLTKENQQLKLIPTPSVKKARKRWLLPFILNIAIGIFSSLLAVARLKVPNSSYLVYALIPLTIFAAFIWITLHCAYFCHGTGLLLWILVVVPLSAVVSVISVLEDFSKRPALTLDTSLIVGLVFFMTGLGLAVWFWLASLRLRKANNTLRQANI